MYGRRETPGYTCLVCVRIHTLTHLDLDFALAPSLLAVGPIAPSLNEIPRTRIAGELHVGSYGRFLCDCQVSAELRGGRGSSKGVGFPLRHS